jgi:hypothetical protein
MRLKWKEKSPPSAWLTLYFSIHILSQYRKQSLQKTYRTERTIMTLFHRPFQEGGTAIAEPSKEERDPKEAQHEREKAIATVRAAVESWAGQHVENRDQWKQKEVQDLLVHLEEAHYGDIDVIAQQVKDRTLFPDNRPVVMIHEGGETAPQIKVFSWREGDDTYGDGGRTEVHDHGLSVGGVIVHDGAVLDQVYGIDRADWEKYIKDGEAEGFSIQIKNAGEKTRGVGEAVSYKPPYIHDLGGAPGFGDSTSLHAYYPPIKVQANFTVEGDMLKFKWRERKE